MPGWVDAVASVVLAGRYGSGVLVAPDLVVTAGHVLVPDPTTDATVPAAADVNVEIAGTVYAVAGVAAHAEWLAQSDRSADMAVVRLANAAGGAALPIVLGYSAAGAIQAQAAGRIGGAVSGPYAIAITRLAGLGGYDMFSGTGLVAPSGVSGGPIVINDAGTIRVVGIATHAADDPAIAINLGLPLLPITYGTLITAV